MRIARAFPKCSITAVEASGPLALLVQHGMKRMSTDARDWAAAASRVSTIHGDAVDVLADAAKKESSRPCVVYLNPCLDLKKPDPADLFLHQLARMQPISALCLHTALDAAKRRVVLRMPRGVDQLDWCHGLLPVRTVRGRSQSDYLVFEK